MKHIPQRTCVGCREIVGKRELIRLVVTPDGVQIDSTGKHAGRGAYMHDQKSCWEKGLKGSLANALRIKLSVKDIERLSFYMNRFPADDGVTNQA